MADRLKNKVAVVTGAARGIGLAVATAYANEGAFVYGVDLHDSDLSAAMSELVRAGHRACAGPGHFPRSGG